MQPGRNNNKKSLGLTQGLTNSASSTRGGATIERVQVQTANHIGYSGEGDSHKTLSGAYDGAYVSGSGQHTNRWGYTSHSGTKIEIDDAPGAGSITIAHQSGSGMVVDPDGSVFVSTTSKRGGGFAAPRGDFYISASGDLVIKGDASISVSTTGDLTINVGGTFNVKCAAYNIITKSMEETIDGSASRTVVNDQSTIIGGINRISVAGDMRQQVSGSLVEDVAGKYTNRVDGDSSNHVGGKADYVSKGKTNIDASADLSIKTSTNLSVSADNTTISSNDATILSSTGSTSVRGQSVKVSGQSASMDGAAVTITGGSMTISAPVVNIPTNILNAPIPTGSGGSGGSPAIESPTTATAPSSTSEAQTADANDIVDSITSARKYPKYIGNGVLESADETAVGMISHDQSPQAQEVFDEYSGANQGNSNPSYVGGSYDTLPETPVNRDPSLGIVDPGIEVPSRNNPGTKISKYFTLGQLANASPNWTIPASIWEQIVSQHILLATNVLDKLKEAFPDMIITNVYRGNSSNHRTGRAVDIVCPSRSLTKHAEMARFARDNLPVDQVFLERNTSGRTHVHLRMGPGSPHVMTCRDSKCYVNTPGINVEWLSRKG